MNKALAFDPGAFAPPPPARQISRHYDAKYLPPSAPAEWRQGLLQLAERAAPRHIAAQRWAQIVADATLIGTVLCDEILAAGWSIENLFGLDPEGWDRCLALRLRGRDMVRIDAQCASIRKPDGYRLHYPRIPAGAPMLWSFNERKVPVG